MANKNEGTSEPEAATRRPMNAFLVFCKRHRGVVKKQYPSLENRSISRILGDWWAKLSEEKKLPFIQFANEYKTSYIKAHPGFRWRNMQSSVGNCRGMKSKPLPSRLAPHPEIMQGPIIPGKLADESQLGMLCNLLGPNSTPVPPQSAPKPPKKRYLDAFDKEIPETPNEAENSPVETQIKGNENDTNKNDHYLGWKSLKGRQRRAVKAPLKTKYEEVNNNTTPSDKGHNMSDDEDPSHKRAAQTRACKGRRYQEFMKRAEMEKKEAIIYEKWESVSKKNPQSPSKRRKISLGHICKHVNAASSNLFDKEEAGEESKVKEEPESNEIRKDFLFSAVTDEKPLKPVKDEPKEDKSIETKTEEVAKGLAPVGSRKRKFRKQEIRRLEPGSSFKDTRVIDSSLLPDTIALDTLADIAAKKEKIRDD